MNNRALVWLSAGALAVGLSGTAQARPLECSGSFSAAYNNGSSLWENELRSTWTDDFKEDCGRVQLFLDANVLSPPSSSDFQTKRAFCQYMGMFDGGERFLNKLHNQCFKACRKDGSTLGQIFGENVCAAWEARGFGPSIDVCTVGEVTGCKNALASTVSSECPDKLTSLKYTRAVENCERLGSM